MCVRSATFYPFARALTERIAKDRVHQTHAGRPFVFWLILFPLVAIIAPSSAIAVMAMLVQGQSPPGAMYGVTAILLTFLFAIVPNAKTVWRNRPRRVDRVQVLRCYEMARSGDRIDATSAVGNC